MIFTYTIFVGWLFVQVLVHFGIAFVCTSTSFLLYRSRCLDLGARRENHLDVRFQCFWCFIDQQHMGITWFEYGLIKGFDQPKWDCSTPCPCIVDIDLSMGRTPQIAISMGNRF